MPTLSNVWEIRMNGRAAPTGETPKAIHNVFHYSIGASTNAPPSNDLLNTSFMGTVANQVLANVTADYTLIETRVRLLDIYENQESIYPVNQPGSVSPDRVPLFVTVVHILRTSYRGRSFMGRKMWSCIPEVQTDHDHLNAAGMAAWANVTGALAASLSVGGFFAAPVVLSRSRCQLLMNPITLIGAPITNVVLNTVLGTLRKRKEKTSV